MSDSDNLAEGATSGVRGRTNCYLITFVNWINDDCGFKRSGKNAKNIFCSANYSNTLCYPILNEIMKIVLKTIMHLLWRVFLQNINFTDCFKSLFYYTADGKKFFVRDSRNT
jgi:hypothetical protein